MARLSTHGLSDDPFARNVIDVTYGLSFSAKALPQKLSTARGAVGLYAAAQGKIPITSRADGGKVVFSDIQPGDRAESANIERLAVSNEDFL
jgi:hypothetical protein